MGKKIHVVNLNGFDATAPSEPQTSNEAEEMSKIKEEVENNEPAIEEPPPTEPPPTETPIEPKAKPKRKPPAKKKEEVQEEVKEELISPPAPPKEEAGKKIKTVELVSCPDCKKEMSKKTLRYSHEKNCTGKPIVREEIPVKRREPAKNPKPKEIIEQYVSIPEEIIQREISKRVREQKDSRMRAKDERIKKLAMNIV